MPFFTEFLRLDRIAAWLLILGGLALAANAWIAAHPEHDPRAPLSIDDPVGWATAAKLAALRGDTAACRAVLARDGIALRALDPVGEGACRREDRQLLLTDRDRGLALSPPSPQASCAVHAALAFWLRHSVQPSARALLGSPVARIEHFGTYSCRRVNGAPGGRWSEHATGNAIDIAAFVLADGTRVSVRNDWYKGADGNAGATPGPAAPPSDRRAAFLLAVRDGACEAFATVLSPDYNAQHADHLHLDQARRGWGGYCR